MNLLALSDHLMIAGGAACIGYGTGSVMVGIGAWMGMVALYRPRNKYVAAKAFELARAVNRGTVSPEKGKHEEDNAN